MGTILRSKQHPLFKTYQNELSNPVQMVLRASHGISISVFDAMLKLTALGKSQLASYLDATPKTIENYRAKQQKLGQPKSEQLLQLMALYKKGFEVFGTIESFSEWLGKNAYGLGKQKPFDLMYTQGGIQLIMEELIRIEYGALA